MFDDTGEIKVTFIRTKNNYDRDAVSRGTSLACSDATRAQQNFKDECDINTIVRNFGVTGTLPTNVRTPINADFIDVMDYQTSLNLMIEAEKAFMQMPSDVRKEFQNDPGKFVEFASDSKNLDRCRELGLAPPKAKEPEIPVVKIWSDGNGPGT